MEATQMPLNRQVDEEDGAYSYTHTHTYMHTHTMEFCVCVCSVMSSSLWPCEAPLSMGFSSQEYWNEFPFLSPGGLPNPGTEQVSCVSCIGRQILYHWAIWEIPQWNFTQALRKNEILPFAAP